MRKTAILIQCFFLLSMLSACSKNGRVAVILDNSGSMSDAGTSFQEIKESVVDSLALIPFSYEKGLRVFDNDKIGSRLVAPYRNDLSELYSVLPSIQPSGGTFIGKSLSDAANDLLEKPDVNSRLIFITDGEGDSSDIETAKEVKQRLRNLKGGFRCNFILFSKKKNPLVETPIGAVSEILGCNMTVQEDDVSIQSLTSAIYRIIGFDFYWLWIIISALVYLALLVWSAQLVFATQYAKGVLPRYAWFSALSFFFSLLISAMGAHIVGFFSKLSGFIWLFVIVALSALVIAAVGIGKGYTKSKQGDKNGGYDPFA